MNNQEILNGSKIDISEYISALKLNSNYDNADLTTILKELVNLFWQEKTPSQDNKGNIGTEQEGEIQEEIILEDKAQRERNQYDLRWVFGLYRKPQNPDNWKPNWNNWNKRIEDIQNLYNAGDKLYTLSVYDIVSNIVCAIHEQVKAQVDLSQELKETINKQYNAIIKLGDILHESDFELNDPYNEEYPEIRKDYLHKLDGMDTLLSNIGDKKFIQLAIAGSYFFDPNLVQEATKELSDKFENLDRTHDLPMARYTTNAKIKGSEQITKGGNAKYTIDKKKYNVSVDVDGNRAVRELITEKTGITIAQGKGSILQNTIISHIWGRAYDPRYFTSLWNIVLIPAWANSLMDKEDAPEGTLASKMRATYMKICSELYKGVFPEDGNKNYLDSLPSLINEKDAIKGGCTFNVIKQKQANKEKIELYKGTGLHSVGDLAKQIIPIIQSDSFPENELEKMTKKDESKKLFGLNFPALVKAENIKEPKRFYKKVIKIKNNEYYLCSQWYEQDREKLNKWLNDHKRHNYSLL